MDREMKRKGERVRVRKTENIRQGKKKAYLS